MATINQMIRCILDNPTHPKGPYVLAVSGGPDSQVLLKAASHVLGPQNCLAVGVHHGLRKEADGELDLAEHLAKQCKVEFRRISVTVGKGPSLLAQAREARYEALFRTAREIGSPFLLTGHHQDDQVETLLIKLLRGTTLTRMTFHTTFATEKVMVVRPLLTHTRKDILKYIRRWKLMYAEDPSNANNKYLRSWVRHELLPSMEEKSPQVRSHITKLLIEASTTMKQQTEEADYEENYTGT
jgi:tRNA(Ile)-lysidine synthetase-like protein